MSQSPARLLWQPDLESQRRLINLKLIEHLHKYPYASPELNESALYSVGSTGHRWRPILFLRIYDQLVHDSNAFDVIPFACAIEFLHTASLVLDDLPAMDDAALRRAQQTCHLRFGQSRTILTAHWLCDVAEHCIQEAVSLEALSDLQNAFRETKTQMMKGQILDLENMTLSEDEIVEKCRLNSGALYSFSASAPAIMANNADAKHVLQNFGEYVGISYQIADDIADVTSTTDVLGKNVHQDIGKRTLPALCGVQKAIEVHEWYKTKALDEIKKLSIQTEDFVEMVNLICRY